MRASGRSPTLLSSSPSAVVNTRRNAANAATFVAADMNAVTGVGAPWYASGVHMWKGTSAPLKPNPVTRSPIAMIANGEGL